MKDEITAAVLFLTRLIGKNANLNNDQMEDFKARLISLLVERFKNHWFPDKPFKGQGYRCIRVNETDRRDPILEKAAQDCGLKYEDLQLPVELTVWVDPAEVCCRFGEHKGSYCTVASFKDGNKENYVNAINIDELETKSQERAKQASVEIMSGKRSNKKNIVPKNKNYNNFHNYQQQFFYQQQQHLYSSSPPNHHTNHHSHPNSHHQQYLYGIQQPSFNKYNGRLPRQHFTNTVNTTGNQSSLRNDRYHWVNKSLVKA